MMGRFFYKLQLQISIKSHFIFLCLRYNYSVLRTILLIYKLINKIKIKMAWNIRRLIWAGGGMNY